MSKSYAPKIQPIAMPPEDDSLVVQEWSVCVAHSGEWINLAMFRDYTEARKWARSNKARHMAREVIKAEDLYNGPYC